MKISKKLFVLPFLVFTMSSCGKTPEDDSKDKEKDKPAEKTQVVIPQLFSGETGTTPLENFTYDGTEKHVHLEGVVSDKVEVKTESVFSATNAGQYSVVVSLKDTSKTCWKDKTTANKTFNWEIEKLNIAGTSYGYRIIVGGYACEHDDTAPYIDKSVVEEHATLGFQFKFYNSELGTKEWTDYDAATFNVTSNGSLDNDGKLVVTDPSQEVSLYVGTSNPNHNFNQIYYLHFEEGILRFHADALTGSDAETGLRDSGWNAITSTHENYMVKMPLNGSGFGVSKMFSAPLTVKFKLDVSEVTSWDQSLEVWFSKDTTFFGRATDVKISRWLDVDSYDYENQYVEFDFSSKEFDGEPYYFQTWFGGGGGGYINVTELIITYNN